MAREDPHFRLRIPAALLESVREESGKSKRTMNAEIILRLTQSFDQPTIVGSGGIGVPMLPDGTVMAGVYLVDASVYESKQQEDGSILLTKRATPPAGA